MVENTIQAIKETEAKADAVVREAESKYRDILDEAAKKAEALKSEQIQNMKQKAQSDMEKAKEKGTQDLDSAMSEIRREVAALKELAQQKHDAAVNLVVSELILDRESITHRAGIFSQVRGFTQRHQFRGDWWLSYCCEQIALEKWSFAKCQTILSDMIRDCG